jgi:hypothetical protein
MNSNSVVARGFLRHLYATVGFGLGTATGASTGETFQKVFQSIYDLIAATDIFGPHSFMYALERDSTIKYPAGPPPFCLMIPQAFQEIGSYTDGGGRLTKVWHGRIEISVVVRNVYDIAYSDTNVFTTKDVLTGPYVILQNIINLLDQSVTELPRSSRVGAPYRFNNSNEYIGIPIEYEIEFLNYMPADLPISP